MKSDTLRILVLSPEVAPFAKTGGLADVAGSLPSALKGLGAEIRIILPFYRVIRDGNFQTRPLLEDLEVLLWGQRVTAGVAETETEDGLPVYLIEREDMYDRPNLYGTPKGDYYDNLERYAFFSHTSLRLLKTVSFTPHIIHCHDWQTGLVPALLHGPLRGTLPFHETRTVFTIHNIGYQGIFPEKKFPVTGLSKESFFHGEGLEFWGNISLLKSGIVYADAITTVSPRYAQEIQTPEYGMGMEGLLVHRRAFLHGILNGVDYRFWDPADDDHLPVTYSPHDLSGKQRCKESLIREMGLAPSLRNRPLLGIISRLSAQKGLDLVVETLDHILEMDTGLVILGTGEQGIHEAIQHACHRHPGRIGLFFGFNEPLAHRIMAGADILLIPSRYEPCGLTQMYALKYGTVPLVRATGGLDDTIVSFNPKTRKGNGFKFGPYEATDLLEAIREALILFEDTKTWRTLMRNGFKENFSWESSARSYMEIYESVLKR